MFEHESFDELLNIIASFNQYRIPEYFINNAIGYSGDGKLPSKIVYFSKHDVDTVYHELAHAMDFVHRAKPERLEIFNFGFYIKGEDEDDVNSLPTNTASIHTECRVVALCIHLLKDNIRHFDIHNYINHYSDILEKYSSASWLIPTMNHRIYCINCNAPKNHTMLRNERAYCRRTYITKHIVKYFQQYKNADLQSLFDQTIDTLMAIQLKEMSTNN